MIVRQYTPFGTIGRMEFDNFSCVTLERPWFSNKRRESCIPEGVYVMRKRESAVVRRITGDPEGWEITDVSERDWIMIHPGNWVRNSDGCVLVGERVILHDNQLFITNSQKTYRELMDVLDTKNEWDIFITHYRPEWP